MIVDILMTVAIYFGITWTIYMSLMLRKEYKKVKEKAVKKVDEIIDKAQQTSEKLALGMMLTATLVAATFAVYILYRYTPE